MSNTQETNYSELLFDTIQTIVDKSIKSLSYDETIICRIVDNTDKLKGQYVVTDGANTFTVYSDNTNYGIGNSVYVTIPQGDYSATKIIIGKYTTGESQWMTYVPPTSSYVNITNNIVEQSESEKLFGLVANRDDIVEIYSNNNVNFQSYNRFGVKIDFKTSFNEKVTSGSYGLGIVLNCINPEDTDRTISVNYKLTQNDMYGNYYNFTSFITQEAVFDIEKYRNGILGIKVYLYQLNNFRNQKNQLINTKKIDYLDDIQVRNLQISFGQALDNFDKDQVLLYTLDNAEYQGSSMVEGDLGNLNNQKELQVRWVHRNDNNEIVSVTPKDLEQFGAEINVYHYKLSENINDPIAGPYWELLKTFNKDSIDFILNVTCSGEVQNEYFKAIVIQNKIDITEFNELIDFYDKIESNQLEIHNKTDVSSSVAVDLIQGVEIKVDVNTPYEGGAYLIYNADGRINNQAESQKRHKAEISYNSLLTGQTEFDGDGSEVIVWKIPKNNTMIKPPELGVEYDEKDVFDQDQNWYYISRVIKSESDGNIQVGDFEQKVTDQVFRIKDYLSTQANNIIACDVIKASRKYTSVAELNFGVSGTNGTNYTMLIEASQNALSPNEKLELSTKLYDFTNKDITNQYNIGNNYNWLNASVQELAVAEFLQDEFINNEPQKFNIVYQSAQIKKSEQDDNTIILDAYLPLAWSSNLKYYNHADVPVKIIYTEQGNNPQYYKGELNLYDSIENKVENVEWKIETYYDNQSMKYYPSIKKTNGQYFIEPTKMYFKELSPCCLSAYVDETLVWAQPLLIMQNQYSNSMINQWDGSFSIDETNGTILSTMIGAGKKDKHNRFSGILMGDLDYSTGLYGYQKGIETFSLQETGEATIGSSGAGQIKINGNSGTIKSGNYDNDGEDGMMINLKDGMIDSYHFRLNSKHITLDSRDNANSFFRVRTEKKVNPIKYVYDGDNRLDWENSVVSYEDVAPTIDLEERTGQNVNLIDISEDNVYFQTMDYSDINETGMKIDLSTGKLSAYDGFKLKAVKHDIPYSANAETQLIKYAVQYEPVDGDQVTEYNYKKYYIAQPEEYQQLVVYENVEARKENEEQEVKSDYITQNSYLHFYYEQDGKKEKINGSHVYDFSGDTKYYKRVISYIQAEESQFKPEIIYYEKKENKLYLEVYSNSLAEINNDFIDDSTKEYLNYYFYDTNNQQYVKYKYSNYNDIEVYYKQVDDEDNFEYQRVLNATKENYQSYYLLYEDSGYVQAFIQYDETQQYYEQVDGEYKPVEKSEVNDTNYGDYYIKNENEEYIKIHNTEYKKNTVYFKRVPLKKYEQVNRNEVTGENFKQYYYKAENEKYIKAKEGIYDETSERPNYVRINHYYFKPQEDVTVYNYYKYYYKNSDGEYVKSDEYNSERKYYAKKYLYDYKKGEFIIDANQSKYPMKVSIGGETTFRLSWLGELFSTSGSIGGWTITSKHLSYGSIYLGEVTQDGTVKQGIIAGGKSSTKTVKVEYTEKQKNALVESEQAQESDFKKISGTSKYNRIISSGEYETIEQIEVTANTNSLQIYTNGKLIGSSGSFKDLSVTNTIKGTCRHAISADSASYASQAGYATNAGYASSAGSLTGGVPDHKHYMSEGSTETGGVVR